MTVVQHQQHQVNTILRFGQEQQVQKEDGDLQMMFGLLQLKFGVHLVMKVHYKNYYIQIEHM